MISPFIIPQENVKEKINDIELRKRNRIDTEPFISGPHGAKASRNPSGKGSQAVCPDRSQWRSRKAGMQMRPTKLLIFGNPKAGTPLMIASPSIAIDLPMKILIWEDAKGKVWVSYNSAAYLQARHGLTSELVQNIAVVEALATKAAE